MKLRIADHLQLRLIRLVLAAAVLTAVACGQKKETAAPVTERGGMESDYAGKIAVLLASDSLGIQDNVRLAQYAYQLASLDAELYRLQNELMRAFFLACDEKCEKHKCSDGEILATAMAYFLDGAEETSAALLSRLGRRDNEFGEISKVMEVAPAGREALGKLLSSGEIKNPLAFAFLAVTALERGVDPAECDAALGNVKSDLLEVDCARAYTHALAGNPISNGMPVVDAWRGMPDFAPLSRNYPEPSFVEEIKGDGQMISRKIYLPLGLYIRMKVDELLLREILNRDFGPEYAPDIMALKALSTIKGLGSIEPDWKSLDSISTAVGRDNPKGEMLASLGLARQGGPDVFTKLGELRYPVSRAVYLSFHADHNSGEKGLAGMLMAEIDSSRQRVIWESRILLSRALLKAAGSQEAFRAMSNLGVSDLSVRNNSPEWLAIYARSGLGEASQLSLASQLIYNLSQHYPQTIGLYEVVQSYNHLCKYY